MRKIAVIGMGKMGLLHVSLLNTIPDVKVVAICEKNKFINHFFKNILNGIPTVKNIEDLEKYHIDATYITTSTASHFPIVNDLLQGGICNKFFVEKPLTDKYENSCALVDLISQTNKNIITMVGYNRRFGVTFIKAKQIIEEGIIGRPRYFESYAFSSAFYACNRTRTGIGRGGVIKDMGSHSIDLAMWYIGDIECSNLNAIQLTEDKVIDSVDFEVCSSDGIRGKIRTSWIHPGYRLPEIGFIIEGEKGCKLIVNDDKLEFYNNENQRQIWYKQDLADNVGFMLGGTDYFREDMAFIEAINTGEMPETNFITALKVDKIINQAEALVMG
jgi:predicted dehydrogenase